MSTRGRPDRSLAAFRNHAAELRKLGATWVKVGQLEARWARAPVRERAAAIGFQSEAEPGSYDEGDYEEDE